MSIAVQDRGRRCPRLWRVLQPEAGRIAHLSTMYGFVIYLVHHRHRWCSATTPRAAIVPFLWWLGGLMVLLGGYWFWFFIRVDCRGGGDVAVRVVRADLFVSRCSTSVTLGLLWGGHRRRHWARSSASTCSRPAILFGSVYWSKFAHMFFKPAAAFEKRVSEANGTAENLPTQTRDDPEQQKRHSMELLQDAPMDMGLGIKREPPRHY
jgi:hypothetical protein